MVLQPHLSLLTIGHGVGVGNQYQMGVHAYIVPPFLI